PPSCSPRPTFSFHGAPPAQRLQLAVTPRQCFAIDAVDPFAVKILDALLVVKSENEIRPDNSVATETHLSLRFIQKVPAKCVINKTARRGEVDERRQNVEMASRQRCRSMNILERFAAVENKGHGKLLVKRAHWTRGNELFPRIMIARKRK